ncbi:PAS domain-containing hybrid sensor histidine kinase/response regulator [Janthinobacterium sp. NKUCC08_JDC]|uniref:sensor histidine kinase n=1 Tax=Janthinobacterium sp. NKUCC08_JDC TaxID=2842122 RepID=UPI001C5B5ADA|nr:PAS domain-containing hybrid sensor histidine kinase/response regulator [Janthinobacterium sp. NKUCC08_JDC]MBW3497087.1 response regulator [Janthinobacterium sp. NKUCC08_JDC]
MMRDVPGGGMGKAAVRRCGRALLLALCVAAAPAAVPAAPPHQGQRVLVLNAYDYGRAGVESYTRTYVAAMAAAGLASEDIMVEHLNLNTQGDPALRNEMRDLLLLRYTQMMGRKADLIVAMQQPALDFLLSDLAPLARGVPVLAINTSGKALPVGSPLAIWQQKANVDFPGTLAQAMALFPETKTIVMAVGASEADQALKRSMQQAAQAWQGIVFMEYLDGLTLAQMRAKVARLPADTLLVTGNVNRDVDGAIATPVQFAGELARLANVPAFGMYNTNVGKGILGGSILHIEGAAQQVARMSLAVLAGKAPAAPGALLPPVRPVPMYDWEQLQRWDADISRLPPNTLFFNRPPQLWHEHRAAVLSAGAVFLAMACMLSALLLQRRRLRRAEGDARESEQRFRILVEHAPEAIVVYDLDLDRFIDANSSAQRMLGMSREALLARGPFDLYTGEQPDGLPLGLMMEEHLRRAMLGEPILVERNVRRADGSIFPCEVRLVRLPMEGRRLVRSGIVDISERKQSEQELLGYRDHLEELVQQRTAALSVAVTEAESANRAKSVFLANMSHELRTPLNSVIGFSQMMADSSSMFEEEKHNLAIINRAGHHLLTLINDILELSKIEAGRMQLQAGPVDLNGLLDEVLEMVRMRSSDQGIALRLERAGVPPLVRLDGAKLRQVLLNLLSNALKFIKQGSVTLSLACQAEDDGQVALAFAVRDTGSGIAEEDLERIFEPFVQADSAVAQAGTGLGLTISREFVRLMGGELRVESTLGAGSMFHFDLRAPRVQCPAVAPLAPGRVARLPAAQRGRTVLLVDDDDNCRKLLTGLLEPLGFQLQEAAGGVQAQAMLAAQRYDIVLSDWRMPDMDGLALTRWLGAQPALVQPRLVIMTASAFEEEKQEALAAGADGFLRKPIEQEHLFAMLEQQLGVRFQRTGAVPPRVPVAPFDLQQSLGQLGADERQALLASVQALDLRRSAIVLAGVATGLPQLAAHIAAMLEQHQYQPLCALLAQLASEPQGEDA